MSNRSNRDNLVAMIRNLYFKKGSLIRPPIDAENVGMNPHHYLGWKHLRSLGTQNLFDLYHDFYYYHEQLRQELSENRFNVTVAIPNVDESISENEFDNSSLN